MCTPAGVPHPVPRPDARQPRRQDDGGAEPQGEPAGLARRRCAPRTPPRAGAAPTATRLPRAPFPSSKAHPARALHRQRCELHDHARQQQLRAGQPHRWDAGSLCARDSSLLSLPMRAWAVHTGRERLSAPVARDRHDPGSATRTCNQLPGAEPVEGGLELNFEFEFDETARLVLPRPCPAPTPVPAHASSPPPPTRHGYCSCCERTALARGPIPCGIFVFEGSPRRWFTRECIHSR